MFGVKQMELPTSALSTHQIAYLLLHEILVTAWKPAGYR